jgi:hypothetical protein
MAARPYRLPHARPVGDRLSDVAGRLQGGAPASPV